MENKNARRLPKTATILLMCASALMLIGAALLLAPTAEAPVLDSEAREAASDAARVAEGCEILQTLTYTRCEHVVTRRATAPVELTGKTLAEVQPLYEEWTITDFSPTEIKMEQRPGIHCPDHVVLMPNGEGALCVFQNKYGDALALVSELETRLDALPAAVQEELRDGVGFTTLAELEEWLESVES